MTSSRGFTLIELMVVIAIVGILSTFVLSSLQKGRLKAADAAVRQEAVQLRNLMEQERTNSGTYTALKAGGSWKATGSTCSAAAFGSSQFSSRAADVCTRLVAATGAACGSNCVFFQTVGPINVSDKYSIVAYLPSASTDAGSAKYLCVGSSGNQSISDGSPWGEDGCIQNP